METEDPFFKSPPSRASLSGQTEPWGTSMCLQWWGSHIPHSPKSKLNQEPCEPLRAQRTRRWWTGVILCTLPLHAKPYHLPNVREEAVSEILCSLNRELGRQIINGTHEDPIALHTRRKHNKLNNSNNNKYVSNSNIKTARRNEKETQGQTHTQRLSDRNASGQ